MNDKSIFKKAVCPVCKKWYADSTGKNPPLCSCGSVTALSGKWSVRLMIDGKRVVKAVSG